VLDALNFAFMGSFEARNGPWGVWTDLVYADFGASKSASRDFTIGNVPLPGGVNADLQLDIKSWIWTLAGVYGLKADAEANVDLLFGTRLLDLSNDLSWNLNTTGGIVNPPPRTGTATAAVSNWDAIVGLKGRAFIGADRTWFVPFYVDIGTGESKFTWQVNAGVGYQFPWGAVIATWRYLDYDFKDSSHVSSMSFNGPTIGVAFKF
jgi:opacity protein-like surface antigen